MECSTQSQNTKQQELVHFYAHEIPIAIYIFCFNNTCRPPTCTYTIMFTGDVDLTLWTPSLFLWHSCSASSSWWSTFQTTPSSMHLFSSLHLLMTDRRSPPYGHKHTWKLILHTLHRMYMYYVCIHNSSWDFRDNTIQHDIRVGISNRGLINNIH